MRSIRRLEGGGVDYDEGLVSFYEKDAAAVTPVIAAPSLSHSTHTSASHINDANKKKSATHHLA